MTATIGRFLQLAGLIILPIGLSIGLFGNDLTLEVRLLFVGGAVFVIGWLISKKT